MKKILSCLFLTTILLTFNYVLAFSIERDLNFLKDLSNEDLNPLIFVMKDGKNSQLNEKEKDNPQKYLSKIVENLEKDATDELGIKDTKSVSYKQILETVCKKQNIKLDENTKIRDIGVAFIRQTFIDTFDKMDQRQREGLIGVLREAMNEEEFEGFLEKIGGTSGLLVSSGEKLSNLLFAGHSGDFMIAICLASDIADAVNGKELNEHSISYTGIVPAVTYIESLRIVKTQMPKSEDNSGFINMLIVVSIPVLCVLLFLICMDPKKRVILVEFIKFLFICFFVAIILLFVMLAMEAAADNYTGIVFVACVILVSMLVNWLLSIQVKIIKNRIKKKNLK